MNESQLRASLAHAADIVPDVDRARSALRGGRQRRRQRRLRGSGVALALAGLITAGVVVLDNDHPAAAAAVASVECAPNRTISHTSKVVTMTYGPIVRVMNNTGGTVHFRFGSADAVLPPGQTESQFRVTPGRHDAQCVRDGHATRAVQLAVVSR